MQPQVGEIRPSEALNQHRIGILSVVDEHRAENPRVFGSVLRGEDTAASDLDMLVDPTAETTLFDIGAMRHKLTLLLGVPVDVVTPRGLPESFRAEVPAQASAV